MQLANIKNKKNREKISCLTVYDATVAKIIDTSSVDIALVGDSLGMVVKGEPDTLGVSIDEMGYHTKIVAKQLKSTYLISDMPYRSYQNPAQSLKNARILCDVGADMVKLEGGAEQSENIKILSNNNISVCGHLGLQPQSIKQLGGYKMQGKTKEQADKILKNAIILEKLGIDLLVLECIPEKLGRQISQTLKIPTIGIGAGRYCDGQVLVITDILGLGAPPKFSKNFLADTNSIRQAIENFSTAVKAGSFP